MRIPLAEFTHCESFCQGVSTVLPRGTNIGCVLVLRLRFVFAIIREGKRYSFITSIVINVVSLLPRNEYLRAFALFARLRNERYERFWGSVKKIIPN